MARRQVHRLTVAATVALAILSPAPWPAIANPVPGFVENWTGSGQGAGQHGWGGGDFYDNPGTGGTGGANDGYLVVSTIAWPVLHLGTRSDGPEYAGDWVAAGIQGIKLWLNDIGEAQPLEIHFALGSRFNNFWQYTEGFTPLNNQWKQFVVDVSSSTGWTRIDGTGSFEDALRSVDRILIRHDLAPYVMAPDQMEGDFGLDQLLLTDETVPVQATTWGRIKAIYR